MIEFSARAGYDAAVKPAKPLFAANSFALDEDGCGEEPL